MVPEPAVQHVLLIEDDETYLELARISFRRKAPGVHLTCIEDGQEAMDRIQAFSDDGEPRPDLVMLDLRLPRVDGWTILKAIRDAYDREQLPVVILSASTDHQDVERSRQLDANGFQSKPGRVRHFHEFLERLLTEGPSWPRTDDL